MRDRFYPKFAKKRKNLSPQTDLVALIDEPHIKFQKVTRMNHTLEPSITDTMNENKIQNSAYVGITALIGGVSLGVVAIIAIFSPENLSVAPWIVGGLSIMGIALGYFSSNRA